MGAAAGSAQDASTRARAVAVARELFAANGYAGTSIADIADRLGVTKAAVYYHFHAKSDLLRELIAPMVEQLQLLLNAPPDDPRVLLESFVDILAAQRSTIGLVAGDPSVAQELKSMAPVELFTRLHGVLAGPHASRTRRLRARCALGAIHAAVVGPVIERHACAPPGAARARGADADVLPMTRYERRVVVDAALSALGD